MNLAALDDLVQLCVQLDQLHRRHDAAGPDPAAPAAGASRGQDALEQAIIGKPITLLLHSR